MNRRLLWAVIGAALLGTTALAMVMAEPKGEVFIAGDKPVTEDQVRQKLQSDGWSNIEVKRDGGWIAAVASKEGRASKVVVDAQTGRLQDDDDD